MLNKEGLENMLLHHNAVHMTPLVILSPNNEMSQKGLCPYITVSNDYTEREKKYNCILFKFKCNLNSIVNDL